MVPPPTRRARTANNRSGTRIRLAMASSSSSSSARSSTTGASSLKPAAIPLMDCGKALARSGELLIEYTRTLELYGGALSGVGANIRNAGDCLAQAAASCRFKTGTELVIDEVREAATCLLDSVEKLQLAAEEADADHDPILAQLCQQFRIPMHTGAITLEAAGANLLLHQSLVTVGTALMDTAVQLDVISQVLHELATMNSEKNDTDADESNNKTTGDPDGLLSAQRMAYAADRLQLAGTELCGDEEKPNKPVGRAFLKGGGF